MARGMCSCLMAAFRKRLVYDLSDKIDVDVHKRNHDIEFRKGEYTRCKSNYCAVADFCSQFNDN